MTTGILSFAACVPAYLKIMKKKEDPLERKKEDPVLENPPANTFLCKICFEQRWDFESFVLVGCNHVFCHECINSYVISKLEEKIAGIKCPELGCDAMLELQSFRSVLAPEVYEKWDDALCESSIPETQKFFCPFRDCSALLLNDDLGIIRQSECPICKRLFCAQCKTPWHSGIECSEFQKLKPHETATEDLMVMTLAMQNKWQRCPKCRFFVERSEGCMMIKCRCGFTFCYNCASPIKGHYCTKCGV